MATTSFTAMRRLAGFAFTLMLFSLCLTGAAVGQGSPLVTASAPAGLNHPTGWNTIQQTAIDSNGDWLVEEYPDGGLFEFPANGGAMITLVPLTGLGSHNGYQNPAVLLDPANNLYVGGNWNNCLLEFPYNSATNSWPTLSVLTAANPSPNECGVAPYSFAQYGIFGFPPYYFQPWGVALGVNNNLIIGNQNSGNWIFSLTVNGAWSNPSAGSTSEIISSMTNRPISIAVDVEGNIYFVEDNHNLSGVYEIPASVVAAGTAGALSSDAGLTRIDPNLPDVTGVVSDPAGNLYISDGDDGVFFVPNPTGTPQTSAAVMLTPLLAQGEVAIDWQRKILYVPTTLKQNNGQADVAKVGIGYAEFGSSPVKTTTTTVTPVDFSFNGSVTPASFVIVEGGMTTPDFAITGGTCTTGTAYAALASCVENLSFTPSAVGNAAAKLFMLDAKNNILASIVLHGTGTGPNVQTTPALQSTIGSGLKTPTQVTTDVLGDTYIADAGLGKVLEYATGSSTAVSIGTGLTSPTGVAVDGAGDVFIADSGAGSVYEIPFGPSGLNAKGQVTLVTGLGTTGLNLAADGLDNLYIADPSKGRVVKLTNISASTSSSLGQTETTLTTGLTAPSAVAVGSNNNLYVIDGVNLFKFQGGVGAPTTLLNNLSGATGVAVDPSGAVYISSASGTTRIPLVAGVLVPADETTVASSVSNTSSVALDRANNVYLTQATGGSVTLVSTNGTVTLPTPATLTSSTTYTATVVNSGNSPLTVTGYTSTNSVDFTAADAATGGCEASSPLAAGATCGVLITFDPGPGEQGTLTSTIGVTSNAVNAPETISATAVGLALANSKSSGTVGSTAQVVSTPLTVTVAPASGTGITPTGTVTVSFPSWNVIVPAATGLPTVNPITMTATGTLNASGQATFTLSPVLAGTQTITVNYGGDRVYGRSTVPITATIAKSSVAGFVADPNPPPYLPFILESGAVSGHIPYDGSQTYWQYTMPVVVSTLAGIPTGTLTFMDNSSTCPPGTSTTGEGAAYCLLEQYSGAACPEAAGAAVVNIQYSSAQTTPAGTSATGNFSTGCLPGPNFVTYTYVVSTHYITPVYSGDSNFLGATDSVSTLFQALTSPEVMITSSPATLSVSPGSSASATLTLTSLLGYGYAGKGAQLNDYNFPVTLSCSNLPPHAVCTFTYPTTVSSAQPSAPDSVQIPCTGTTGAADNCSPGIVTLTINTSVSVGTTSSQNAAVASVTLAAIFGFGTLGLFFRRKVFRKGRLLLMIFLMIVAGALATSLTACNITNLTPLAVVATPAGTYPVTVTADQVGEQTISLPTGPVEIAGSENQVSFPFYINVTVQ